MVAYMPICRQSFLEHCINFGQKLMTPPRTPQYVSQESSFDHAHVESCHFCHTARVHSEIPLYSSLMYYYYYYYQYQTSRCIFTAFGHKVLLLSTAISCPWKYCNIQFNNAVVLATLKKCCNNIVDVGLLVVTIWLQLCRSYSSSCHHHLSHP